MTWSVTYNGAGTAGASNLALSNVNLESVSSRTIFDEDEITPQAIERVAKATFLIPGTSAANLAARIAAVQNALAAPDKALAISVGGSSVYTQGAGEGPWPGYPRVESTVKEIAGTLTALVTAEITWRESFTADTVHVLSHSWSQEWDQDQDGLLTWTVTGTLSVALTTSGGSTTAPNLGNNPDAYRELIEPALQDGATFSPKIPAGFRLASRRFVVDTSGRRLSYSMSYRQHDRSLPAPARSGDGTFTWRRTLDGGLDFIGMKVFEAELVGGKEATPAQLLASLIGASQKRIDYVADWIQEIEVSERNIFDRNAMSLRVVAVGTSIEGVNSSDPWGRPFDLTQQIVTDEEHQDSIPNSYGTALVRSATKILFDPAGGYAADEFPRAGYEELSADEEIGNVVEIPDEQYDDLDTRPPGGVHKTTVTQAQVDAPYLSVSIKEDLRERPNVAIARNQSFFGVDRPYQHLPPTVTLETTVEMTRKNRQPDRVMTAQATGSVVLERDWVTSSGGVDANDSRVFANTFKRLVQFGRWGNSANFVSESVVLGGIGTFTVSRWYPPLGVLSFPADPRTEANPVGRESLNGFAELPDFNLSLFLPNSGAGPNTTEATAK